MGLGSAIYQWCWLADKSRSNIGHSGERLAMTIGDDVIPLIHIANSMLLFTGTFSVWASRHQPGSIRHLVLLMSAANLAAWLMIILMYATGILIGYDEFMQRLRQPH
jgi:hypothetical protein